MGTGGARHGAGRRETRPKVERLLQLRVGDLKHFGLASASKLSAEESASLVLKSKDPSWRFTQSIELTRTPCHFGGERLWFRCPACTSRVGLLLLYRGRFACRTCVGANYRSQAMDPISRTWKRQRALEAQIGVADGLRPKGMHSQTYRALKARVDKLRQQRDRLGLGALRSLTRSGGLGTARDPGLMGR